MLSQKYLLLFSVISIAQFSNAQVINYCGSSRYDTEVFQSVQKTTDIIYGSNTSPGGSVTTLMLDVYEPAGDTIAERPLIIWAHGGSFIGGTKSNGDVVSLCEHFAKRGYVCVSIDYRLGFSIFPPDAAAAAQTIFRAVQDMKAAVRFFRKDAATNNNFHVNPDIIFGGGSSAGAFTALQLAYLDQPSEIPAGIDTMLIGGLEGSSGNEGYSSNINAVIDLCGALGDKTWIHQNDVPFVAMHGNLDATVPYKSDTIYLLGSFPITKVDGSFSISEYANTIGLHNELYTFFGADHIPYVLNISYMDTTVRFVSNFLYNYLGCTPSDPTPFANTFPTGINSVLNESVISIYPNPGNGIFRINFSTNEKKMQLSIFEISGKKLKEFYFLENNPTINLSEFASGIYFYSIVYENKFFSGKLIIQNK